MSTEIDKKRKALLKAYPGYSWHEKVAGWSSEQVIAVFLRFEREGWPQNKPKPEPKPPEEPDPEDSSDDKPDDDQFRLF